jgi:hypothetical protein
VADRAGGLEDLDWNDVSTLLTVVGLWRTARLTPDKNVKHENNETDDSTASAVLSGGVLGGDGRGGAEGC